MEWAANASYVLLWILTVFLLIVAVGALAEVKRLQDTGSADSRLPLGSRAPAFRGIDPRSAETVKSQAAPRRHLRLFLSPSCITCRRILLGLREVSEEMSEKIIVICRGDEDSRAGMLESAASHTRIVADPDGEIARRHGVRGTPGAVLVESGRVANYAFPRTLKNVLEMLEPTLTGHRPETEKVTVG